MKDLAAQLLEPARQRYKYACPACRSSDAAHAYDDHLLCFSCGKSFDDIELVRVVKGIGFKEAVAWLGKEVESDRPHTPKKRVSKVAEHEYLASAKEPAQAWAFIGDKLKHKPLSDAACAFLEARALDPELCYRLGVRCVTRTQWDGLRSALDDEALRDAGILHKGKHGDYMHPHYKGAWLLFPYRDGVNFPEPDHIWQTVRHRTIEPHAVKCMSAAGSQAMPLPYLGEHITDDVVWIVEGETDALSIWQAGGQAVGAPGASVWRWSHLVEEWLGSGKRVIVVGDGDQAGQEFAARVAKPHGTQVVARLWPAGMDANDLLKAGELTELIQSARGD